MVSELSCSERCLQHILEKNLSGAKALLYDSRNWKDGECERGRRFALSGIISMRGSNSGGFDGDLDKMDRVLMLLSNRLKSIWCDDLERGYFEVWTAFIEKLRREASGHMKEGVDENPAEEE